MQDKRRTSLAVAMFTACSSTMLIVNKLAVTKFPAPAVLLLLQLGSSSLALYSASRFKLISLEDISRDKARPYVSVSLAFLASLYANVKILQFANVETFIVFRSSTPVAISALDYLFLGRQLPSRRSSISLLGMFLAAIAYVETDSQFEVQAYSWVAVWYIIFCFDQVYIKHVVDNAELSAWSRSFCTNTFACIPAFVYAVLSSEYSVAKDAVASQPIPCTAFIVLSCMIGVAMSVSSFHLRGLVSATQFTVIGTACKIISVIINFIIWEKHASLLGLCALGFSIFSASWYQQAPHRNVKEADEG